MKKTSLLLSIALCGSLVLAGCTEREKGTLIGSVIGGAAGSLIGKGQGRMLAIGLGTAAGALFGQHIGDRLDRAQSMKVDEQVMSSLESNRDGQASRWQDPNAGVSASTLPLRTYQTASGQYCREFQQEITVDAEVQRAYGTACRQPDGSWKIVS